MSAYKWVLSRALEMRVKKCRDIKTQVANETYTRYIWETKKHVYVYCCLVKSLSCHIIRCVGGPCGGYAKPYIEYNVFAWWAKSASVYFRQAAYTVQKPMGIIVINTEGNMTIKRERKYNNERDEGLSIFVYFELHAK